jgi:hypothetical protein
MRVRDELERDVVDARRARRGAVRQPGQLAIVAARQVPPGGPDLLLDQVVVVDEPFGRRGDAPAARHRIGDQGVCLAQRHLVRGEPGQEPIGDAAAGRTDLVPAREHPRVLLELAHAEELGAHRLLFSGHAGTMPLAIAPAAALAVALASDQARQSKARGEASFFHEGIHFFHGRRKDARDGGARSSRFPTSVSGSWPYVGHGTKDTNFVVIQPDEPDSGMMGRPTIHTRQ